MLDSASETSVFPISFRYLQKVQTAISLPQGFVPEALVSRLTLVAPRRITTERRDAIGGSATAALANPGIEDEASDSRIR
jgi:hypothetical protein